MNVFAIEVRSVKFGFSCSNIVQKIVSILPNPWPDCIKPQSSFTERREFTNINQPGTDPLFLVFESIGQNEIFFYDSANSSQAGPQKIEAGQTKAVRIEFRSWNFTNNTYTLRWQYKIKVFKGSVNGNPCAEFLSMVYERPLCQCCDLKPVDSDFGKTIWCLDKGQKVIKKWKFINKCNRVLDITASKGINITDISIYPTRINPNATTTVTATLQMPQTIEGLVYTFFKFSLKCLDSASYEFTAANAVACCDPITIKSLPSIPIKPQCGNKVDLIFEINALSCEWRHMHSIRVFYNPSFLPPGWSVVGTPQIIGGSNPITSKNTPLKIKYTLQLPNDVTKCKPNTSYNTHFTFEYKEGTNDRRYALPKPFYVLIKTAP